MDFGGVFDSFKPFTYPAPTLHATRRKPMETWIEEKESHTKIWNSKKIDRVLSRDQKLELYK